MKNEKIDYEIWVEANNKQDIEVSNHGRIRHKRSKRIVKTVKTSYISKGAYIKYWEALESVSEIMATTFLKKYYFNEEKTVIKFIDNNPFNTHLNNIELITEQEETRRNYNNL